jgi:Tol biopolymer transport system component
MNADGTNQTMLTNGQKDYGPNWSPDGSKILFYSLRDGQEEIYVIDADGTDLTRLTDHLARDQYCCWSPDGSKIAFTSERESSNYQIYVMDANGSNITRLTNNSAEDSQPNWCVHE